MSPTYVVHLTINFTGLTLLTTSDQNKFFSRPTAKVKPN